MKQYVAKLRKVKGKYYVSTTIPVELRDLLGHQRRKSTGTSDKKKAELLYPKLALELQDEIRNAKDSRAKSTLANEVKKISKELGITVEKDIDGLGEEELIQQIKTIYDSNSGTQVESFATVKLTNLKTFLDKTVKDKKNTSLSKRSALRKMESLLQQYSASGSSISSVANEYERHVTWARDKSRNAFKTHVNKFREYFNDVEISDITSHVLYSFAEELAFKNNHSNATVKNYMSSISNVLSYAVRKGYIEINPAKGLDLRTYGKSKLVRKPFSEAHLNALFQLDLTPQVRMLWSILITTGMRLDEAALLERSNLESEKGILHFNLTDAVVKNTGSARKVPVPRVIADELESFMRGTNTDRLFSFPLNADGKAQNAASKASMRYIRKIIKEPNYVTHSFRHTFKDLCRDAGIAKDLHDFITGHSGGDSASHYGEGHSLKARETALNAIEHPWLG